MVRRMASQFDEPDFVDRDFEAVSESSLVEPERQASPKDAPSRLLTREELEAKVGSTQTRLADLKRAQEALERERASLEEVRRRRSEYYTGKDEMIRNLTRGVGILEEAELQARRESEQMTKALESFNESLGKVNGLTDEEWDEENLNVELTRALTTIDNARMEWNAARLKWAILDGKSAPTKGKPPQPGRAPMGKLLDEYQFSDLCRIGLGLTWPLAVVALIAIIMFGIIAFQN